MAVAILLSLNACGSSPAPSDASAGSDADGSAALDAGCSGAGEGGVIDLEAGCRLPEGRVRCYFAENYNCNREGEDCCEAEGVCYFPATEPEFCPGT